MVFGAKNQGDISILKKNNWILMGFKGMAVKPGFTAVITRIKIRTRKKPKKIRKKNIKRRKFLRILAVI